MRRNDITSHVRLRSDEGGPESSVRLKITDELFRLILPGLDEIIGYVSSNQPVARDCCAFGNFSHRRGGPLVRLFTRGGPGGVTG